MKVGSIVESITSCSPYCKTKGEKILMQPLQASKPYTIRGICNREGKTGVYLEEIINIIHPVKGVELAYNIKHFRELLPPMEIQDALDSCEPVLIELNK